MGDKRLICCDNCGKVILVGIVIEGSLKVKCRYCPSIRVINEGDKNRFEPKKYKPVITKEDKKNTGR